MSEMQTAEVQPGSSLVDEDGGGSEGQQLGKGLEHAASVDKDPEEPADVEDQGGQRHHQGRGNVEQNANAAARQHTYFCLQAYWEICLCQSVRNSESRII